MLTIDTIPDSSSAMSASAVPGRSSQRITGKIPLRERERETRDKERETERQRDREAERQRKRERERKRE